MLSVGITGESEDIVTIEKTALSIHSGGVFSYATPAMIALMEKTAYESIAGYLEKGESTVGTYVEVKHLAPTPLGMAVRAKSVVTSVDGRKICFHVEAFDRQGKIGEGKHERVIVQKDTFQAKTDAKLLEY